MRAVAALTELRNSASANALVDCAFKYPTDVELLKSIIAALKLLPKCDEKKTALGRLAFHSSYLIKRDLNQVNCLNTKK